MSANEMPRDQDLAQALAGLQQQVRREPADPKHRIYLFQLQCILGAWEKALNQLGVLHELDAGTIPMVQTYREAIRCEVLRARVFAGQRAPLLFGEPRDWVALVLESLQRLAAGQYAEAARLRDAGFAAAPATSGQIDGQPFAWIADADPRLGPILEAIIEGRYYWVPLDRVRSIRIEPPTDLRDLVWMPAAFTWTNGGESVGLIPTRYPGSETSADDGIRLARRTEWLEPAEGVYFGLGQRMLTADSGDYALMDVRHIALDAAAESETGASAPTGATDPAAHG